MFYFEDKKATEKERTQYLDGIKKYIDNLEKKADIEREKYFKDIFSDVEKYRNDLRKMLGTPLTNNEKRSMPNVREKVLSQNDNMTIYRMQIEVLDDVWLSGLFFKLKKDKKRPLVIAQHGGLGTPELISGFGNDDTGNYHKMVERVLQEDTNVFAPQLLIWSVPLNGVEFNRQIIDGALRRVGSSITAVEVYAIMRVMDFFETKEYVTDFGMLGLSYGGFYTMMTAAIDTRIKSCLTCSQFNKREEYPWADWSWQNAAEKFGDAEIATLIYPRKLYIAVGDNDEAFESSTAKSEYERIEKICSEVGCDWVGFEIFQGVHEFLQSDAPIKNLVEELKS